MKILSGPQALDDINFDDFDHYRKSERIRSRKRPMIDTLSPGIPGADNRWFPTAQQARRAALRQAHRLTRIKGATYGIKHSPNERSNPHYHVVNQNGRQMSGHFYYSKRVPYRRLKRRNELEFENDSDSKGMFLHRLGKKVGAFMLARALMLPLTPASDLPDVLPPLNPPISGSEKPGNDDDDDDGDSLFEMEWAAEAELISQQKLNIDALLEDLGYAAEAAQTEAEAEALVGAMVPLAAQLIPRVKPLMMVSSPAMVAGLGAATKLLHRNPKTRPLLRTMPTILHHTAAVLNRDRINGRRPTPKRAVKVLADQAAKVIASPDETRRALQHAREMSHHH